MDSSSTRSARSFATSIPTWSMRSSRVSGEIEAAGLEAHAEASGRPIEEAFETLLTGLAVRYFKAVAG